ncbi:MAG: hypothetical protein J6A59_05895 [Lachnospiraceae bacterium]|nr:hypothetical protein [Lachnospiraceae bacterium]MBO5407442.1 hypothetical protein [Bacteroidales bacterium]
MKSSAIISAAICYIFAFIAIVAAVINLSFIGAVIAGILAYMGRDFYRSREIV